MTTNFRSHTIHYSGSEGFWAGLNDWEKESFDVMDKYLKRGKVLLDIGAWNGVFSLYAEKLGATSFAIEPDVKAFNEMIENMTLNDSSSIFPYSFAISNYDGEIDLYNHDTFGNSMSSIVRKDGVSKKVKCRTLETFHAHYGEDGLYDLIKMDIEGAELLVIPTSMDFFKRSKCPLLLSIHPYYFPDGIVDTKRLLDCLEEIYTVEMIAENSWLCVPKN